MKNECFDYAANVANDLRKLYNGETVDECENIYDYISDALDVEYTLDSSRRLIGVNIYFALGGPTCWIDTRRCCVICHWASEDGYACVPSEICEEINMYFEELF